MAVFTLMAQGVTLANAGNASPQLTFTAEFTLTASASLTGIWFYSPAGAAGLPDQCVLFDTSTQAEVSGTLNASPSWSGAAASGWVKCTYSPVALTSGHTYLVAVHVPPASSDGYGKTSAFWTTGPGASGIVSGPLSAPNYSTSTLQGAVASGQSSITYPTITESGAYFGVDVEVTTSSAVTGTGSTAASKPSLSGSGRESMPGSGGVRLPAPGLSGAGKESFPGSGGTVAPSPSLHGAGWTTVRGSGGVSLVKPSLAGAGRAAARVSGSGAIALVKPSLAGFQQAPAQPAQTGSWWGLVSVLRHNQQEFDAYQSMPSLACPVCGEPLKPPPNTPAGAATELYCPYAGDHQYHEPRDRVRPMRPSTGRPGVM